LTDILRGEWKFRGFVVSDYESVGELIEHGVTGYEDEAARLALTAGVDMEMVSLTYHDTLKKQVEQGVLPKEVLDEAVRRVLTVKFEKGLFEHPYTDEYRYQAAFLRDDALALAREAAEKSCVLLKNTNNALPLSPHVKKIALIGPLAATAEELVGPWHSSAHTNDLVSLAEAMLKKINGQLLVARGCSLVEPDVIKVPRDIQNYLPLKITPTGSNEIADAVELAKSADTVVMALGEPLDWSGEDGSRSDINLPGRQQELFDAVAATGKPVIVVLFNGRPLALPRVQEKASAILEAWFPGTQGANAVANLLFGDAQPVGRLTTTFLRSVGQAPFHYNHFNTGRPGFGAYKGTYVDIPTTPLYPFGFGLAYTTFDFGKASLSVAEAPVDGKFTAQTEIKNTGSRAGTAVVQLYIRALAGSAGPRPVRELKGFQKVLLQPNEQRTVSFELSAKDLGYYDAQGHWLVERGNYQVWLSADSASGEPAKLILK
ncbi:MAG TPA: glycoside hydrolase family 3 C-terminal domain-containing protein, partial [Verrucomicrobiae bacterium]